MKTLTTKIKATSIHLSISLVIFFILLYIMLTKWFPSPFFELEGGWQGVKILIFVDLVLGPLLTFLVINPEKTAKQTAIDLSIIALIQLSALTWGINNIHSQRILAISYSTGVSTAFPIRESDLAYQSEDETKIIQKLISENPDKLLLSIRPHYKEYEQAKEMLDKVSNGIPEHAQAQILTNMTTSNANLVNANSTFPSWVKFKGNFYEGRILVSKDGDILELKPIIPKADSDTN